MSNSAESKQKLLHLLGLCQVIEFALKLLISRKQHYLELEAGRHVSSKQIYEELTDKPLGLLIKRLEKVSDNKLLVEKLRTIKRERDYLAHQALLQNYKIISDFLQKFDSTKEEFDFMVMHNQLTECLTLIFEEAESYLAKKKLCED